MSAVSANDVRAQTSRGIRASRSTFSDRALAPTTSESCELRRSDSWM